MKEQNGKKEEIDSKELGNNNQSPAVNRQELIQHLRTSIASMTSLLTTLESDQTSETDSASLSNQIQKDSLKLQYSVKLESVEGVIVNFNNTTNIHQAIGKNPTQAVSRVSGLITAELLEPLVLSLQDYITGLYAPTALQLFGQEEESTSDGFLSP